MQKANWKKSEEGDEILAEIPDRKEHIELVEQTAKSWWNVNHRWSRPKILWDSLKKNVKTTLDARVLYSVKVVQHCSRCGSIRETPAYYLKTLRDYWGHWELMDYKRMIIHPPNYRDSPCYKEYVRRRSGKGSEKKRKERPSKGLIC